jgi:hypothetical protein
MHVLLCNMHCPTHTRSIFFFKRAKYFLYKSKDTIIVAVTEGLVREEQLLHDMCLLGAVTVEITQILTRARTFDVSISEPLLR